METINQQFNSGQKPGIVQQIIFGVALVLVVYLILLFIEIIYKYINRLAMNRTELLPYTYAIENKTINIPQNPNLKGAKTVNLSDNERAGIEFTYSFYIYVHPSSFRQEMGLLHVFHKGYSQQFPLLAPGVYMRSDTNTLRVYMNSYKTWNNYCEIENFPIAKWVQVVITCKESALEVFINGNLTKRLAFEGFAPYQNYQDICCFSQRRITLKKSIVPSVDENGFDVFGCVKGLMSRLNYFSYCLSYAEIQQLLGEGPSTKMDSSLLTENVPPYLADSWWSQGY